MLLLSRRGVSRPREAAEHEQGCTVPFKLIGVLVCLLLASLRPEPPPPAELVLNGEDRVCGVSDFVLLAEHNTSPGISSKFYFNWRTESTEKQLGLRNHLGGANFLHADGHVSHMRFAEGIRGTAAGNRYFYANGTAANGRVKE